MTRRPRSDSTSRRTPITLSRTGITTVTSRCDGPVAGRGWATVASSRVRASRALTSSWTCRRPSHSMLCAAGANRSNRVGEPPSRALPSPSTRTRRSTCTANPFGSRACVMSTSRRPRAATGRYDRYRRRPSQQRSASPRPRWPWWGPPARRCRSLPPPRPGASPVVTRAVARRCPPGSARRGRPPVKCAVGPKFRCDRHARRRRRTHTGTSRRRGLRTATS